MDFEYSAFRHIKHVMCKKYEPLASGDLYKIEGWRFENESSKDIYALVLEDSSELQSVVYVLLPNLKTVYVPKRSISET